jgi:hypothetical protein
MAIRPYIAIRPYKGKEVDMFWHGLIIGIFIGANVGLLVLGLLIATRDSRPVEV